MHIAPKLSTYNIDIVSCSALLAGYSSFSPSIFICRDTQRPADKRRGVEKKENQKRLARYRTQDIIMCVSRLPNRLSIIQQLLLRRRRRLLRLLYYTIWGLPPIWISGWGKRPCNHLNTQEVPILLVGVNSFYLLRLLLGLL